MLHGGMHPLANSPALLSTFLRYEEDEGYDIAHIYCNGHQFLKINFLLHLNRKCGTKCT